MTTLREAAQQALEALRLYKVCYGTSPAEEATLTALRAALAEPVQEQPVCDECGKSKRDGWALYCVDCLEPMFAQRKPLTDEGINALELPPSGTATVRDLVRLIERAHGIGGQDEP